MLNATQYGNGLNKVKYPNLSPKNHFESEKSSEIYLPLDKSEGSTQISLAS